MMTTETLHTAFEWTLHNSLGGSIMILLLLGTLTLWRNQIALPLRFAIWSLVALRLLLPMAIPSQVSIFNFLPDTLSPVTATAPISAPEEVVVLEDPFAPVPQDAEGVSSSATLPASPGLDLWSALTTALALGWLAGVLVILGRNMWAHQRLARSLRRCPQVRDQAILHILNRCLLTSQMQANFNVVSVPAGQSVAIFGFLRPTHLLIPEDLAEHCTEAEIRGILFHELGHIRRRDLFWNWVALSVRALHWFNPLVWIAHRRFRADQELSCDRSALAHLPGEQRRDYGQALLKLATTAAASPARQQPALIPFFPHASAIQQRLTMIAKPQATRTLVQVWAALVVLAICGFTFTSAQADQPGGSPSPEAKADKPASPEAGAKPAGPRDGDPSQKTGPKDGEGAPKTGLGDTGKPSAEGDKGPSNSPEANSTKTGPRDTGKPSAEGSKTPAPASTSAVNKNDPKFRTKEGKIFLAYDKDGNGMVSAEEAAGMTEKEESRREMRDLSKLIEEIDKDGNEAEMNFDEFQVWRNIRRNGGER